MDFENTIMDFENMSPTTIQEEIARRRATLSPMDFATWWPGIMLQLNPGSDAARIFHAGVQAHMRTTPSHSSGLSAAPQQGSPAASAPILQHAAPVNSTFAPHYNTSSTMPQQLPATSSSVQYPSTTASRSQPFPQNHNPAPPQQDSPSHDPLEVLTPPDPASQTPSDPPSSEIPIPMEIVEDEMFDNSAHKKEKLEAKNNFHIAWISLANSVRRNPAAFAILARYGYLSPSSSEWIQHKYRWKPRNDGRIGFPKALLAVGEMTSGEAGRQRAQQLNQGKARAWTYTEDLYGLLHMVLNIMKHIGDKDGDGNFDHPEACAYLAEYMRSKGRSQELFPDPSQQFEYFWSREMNTIVEVSRRLQFVPLRFVDVFNAIAREIREFIHQERSKPEHLRISVGQGRDRGIVFVVRGMQDCVMSKKE